MTDWPYFTLVSNINLLLSFSFLPRSVTFADSGEYTCRVNGARESLVQLLVQGKEKIKAPFLVFSLATFLSPCMRSWGLLLSRLLGNRSPPVRAVERCTTQQLKENSMRETSESKGTTKRERESPSQYTHKKQLKSLLLFQTQNKRGRLDIESERECLLMRWCYKYTRSHPFSSRDLSVTWCAWVRKSKVHFSLNFSKIRFLLPVMHSLF